MDNPNIKNKLLKKEKKKSKRRERLEMYDMLLAILCSKDSIIEPSKALDGSQIAIGYNGIASRDTITKYYVISKFPDYIQPRLIDNIRNKCMRQGLKINFYFYAVPHKINWDSSEMRNRMAIWRKYSDEHSGNMNVFSYRTQRNDSVARNRIIMSTKYLNEAELDFKRSFLKVSFIIEVQAKRNEQSIANMDISIKELKDMCKQSDIKLTPLRINMIDWLRALDIFSLRSVKEVDSKIAKRVVTDDILANMNSYKQGRIGTTGVPLGIDVLNGGPVMRKFKEDPDAADNWIISAGTGGGKSYWVKALLTFLLADGFVVSVMDYEGDEYNNLANYIKAGNPDDVKVVSMGKGSNVYFDPCEIPDLTGDPDVDNDLKDSAIEFIIAIFRLIVCGLDRDLTKEENKVLSLAISRMYDTVCVTEDPATWHRSSGLRLADVYAEVKAIVESKELVDNDADNLKHKAAVSITDSASIYFEPGEARSNVFKQPMSANELFKSKLIIFSFGMKGASANTSDSTILALKQLSVAYVNIRISNYCKYVRRCFNVKVWEEFQRWGEAKGSAETISNVITGGRKRGDVNFIITNDLSSMLSDTNPLNEKIRQNVQNYAIGKISDKKIRAKFCDTFDLQDIRPALDIIAKASPIKKDSISKSESRQEGKYEHAFCVVLEDGKKATVKVHLPKALADSKLFKTGVDINNN